MSLSDSLDLLIKFLNEHEKKLDDLIYRFEKALEIIEKGVENATR